MPKGVVFLLSVHRADSFCADDYDDIFTHYELIVFPGKSQ